MRISQNLPACFVSDVSVACVTKISSRVYLVSLFRFQDFQIVVFLDGRRFVVYSLCVRERYDALLSLNFIVSLTSRVLIDQLVLCT